MSTILHTDKLCKSFSNGGLQQHIIKNLDLEIRPDLKIKILDDMLLQAAVWKWFAQFIGMKNRTHVYPSIVIEKKFVFLWYYTSYFKKVFICLLFVSYLFIKWIVRNNKKALPSVIENNAHIMFLFLNLSHFPVWWQAPFSLQNNITSPFYLSALPDAPCLSLFPLLSAFFAWACLWCS